MEELKEFNNNGSGNKYINLTVEYGSFKTLPNRKFQLRKPYKKRDFKKITAFIPGKILSVAVQKGDRVTHETCLVILEAMKMKNKLFPSVDGIVKDVYVKVGDMVKKDMVLVELE
ncbi:MAG: acetyl-CoA carboxylase biotin carboxyl carrier protein subunit [Bacteroidales bacterium]|jgi:biotin carboxyl carrier protein